MLGLSIGGLSGGEDVENLNKDEVGKGLLSLIEDVA
jgi:hypothetical protein